MLTRDELRRMRKKLGVTQSGFAQLIGVHVVTVKKWETGMGMKATTERLIRLLVKEASKKKRSGPGGRKT